MRLDNNQALERQGLLNLDVGVSRRLFYMLWLVVLIFCPMRVFICVKYNQVSVFIFFVGDFL